MAAFPASRCPQLAKVQHLKATGRRLPIPTTLASVIADCGFTFLPPYMFHQILQVHLFALLEEKEEPDPKEGISKGGGRGARRPTKEATSPNTIHSMGWDDHHRGQGGKLGEDTERPTRSGQETGCGGQCRLPLCGGRREPARLPVALSLCWRRQRAWPGLAGSSQRTRADGNPKVSVSPTVAPLKRTEKEEKGPVADAARERGPAWAPRPPVAAHATLGRGRSSSPPGAC